MIWKARNDCKLLVDLYREDMLQSNDDKIKAIKLISKIFYNLVPRTSSLDVPNVEIAVKIIDWFVDEKPVDWRDIAKAIGSFLEVIELGLIESKLLTQEQYKAVEKLE
tara:strand:+ start:8994 stop:9317 length:324 start_codon:yes stop_codon:yes gene_type:complete